MSNEHRADPTPHHGQGRGGSKKESFSLMVSPALHPPERPSPRRADIADHGLGRETRERRCILILIIMHSHQSYPNITTVIHSYEYNPTIDNSTIETSRSRGLGK